MNEYNFENYLENNPELLEKGLKVIQRQKKTYFGVIDLFCEDTEKRKVIIELKINPRMDSIAQVCKYIAALIKEGYEKEELRAMLVSQKIDQPIKEVCNLFNIETKEIPFTHQHSLNETSSTLERIGAILDRSSLSAAKTELDPDKVKYLTDREISILYVISELNKRNEKAAYTNIAQILKLTPGTIRGFINDMREKIPIQKERMLPNGSLFYLSPEVLEYLEEKFQEFKRKFEL